MFSVTYFGYAAVLVQLEKHILFDPGIIDGIPLVNFDNIHPSYVLITHTREEHFGNAVRFANNKGSVIVGNSEVCDFARNVGAYSYAITPIEEMKSVEIGANIRITGYNLRRGGFLAPQNTAFLVESDQGTILHLGHAKKVDTLANLQPDLLCVPIAGKKKGTLSPEEAANVTLAIHSRYVLPISGNEFQKDEFIKLLNVKQSNVHLVSLTAGETTNLF